MKTIVAATTVMLAMLVASACSAAPTLISPTMTAVGANIATLVLQSSATGTGYFTLLNGKDANCGTGTQVKAGLTASEVTAPYFGSLPLTANTAGNYTIRNLRGSTDYTVCFTADPSPDPDCVAANFTTGAATAFTSSDWRAVGTAGFSVGSAHFTSLAFAPDGTPYVAYVDANNSYKITVMKYSGNAWETVGNAEFAAGTANPASLAFAPDGTPHVSFLDADNSYRATVMSYTGTLWSAVGSGFLADTDSTSLAFAPDGTPYVSYIDANDSKATVMKYSTGAWNVLGSYGLSSSGAWSTSLAIAPDGTPFVAYSDYGNSAKMTVMKYSVGSWAAVGIPGFSGGVVSSISLAIAPDGTLFLAYQDGGNGNKATVKKFNGTTWIDFGVAGFSAGIAINTSLAIAPDGTLYVAYQDGGNGYKATVMKSSGGAWSVVGSLGFSAGTVNSTSLAFAPDGTPYVAYGDNGNGSRATVMKLINLTPTISGPPVTTATVGVPYIFTPLATYAESFSVTDNLPPGLSLNSTTGVLSGTPTIAGTYNDIVITATNNIGSASLSPFTIDVIVATLNGNVKIGSSIYSNLTTALAAANDGNTLKLLSTVTHEGVNYGGSGVITLEGGYDAGWIRQAGLLAPVSSLTITSGTLVIDQIVVN